MAFNSTENYKNLWEMINTNQKCISTDQQDSTICLSLMKLDRYLYLAYLKRGNRRESVVYPDSIVYVLPVVKDTTIDTYIPSSTHFNYFEKLVLFTLITENGCKDIEFEIIDLNKIYDSDSTIKLLRSNFTPVKKVFKEELEETNLISDYYLDIIERYENSLNLE